jgi:8-oxo-dGTP pyrophosphatase MutT (NUDIX family)
MIREWTILERKPLEDHKIFKVHTKIVRSPRTGAAMEVKAISFRDWVMVLPLTADGKVIMINQYRHGIEAISLELPGGLIDPCDDSPEAAARRELLEETGYEAQEYQVIGSCFPQPAVLENRGFFVLASDARLTCEMQPDPGEEIEVAVFSLDDIPGMIQNGRIPNGMVQLAFYKYFMRNRK